MRQPMVGGHEMLAEFAARGGNVRSVWAGEQDLAGQGLVGQTKGLEELTTHVFFCLVICSFNIYLMNIQRTPGTLHVKSFKQETGARFVP